MERPGGRHQLGVVAVHDSHRAADRRVHDGGGHRGREVRAGGREARHGLRHRADPGGQHVDGEGRVLGVLAHRAPPS